MRQGLTFIGHRSPKAKAVPRSSTGEPCLCRTSEQPCGALLLASSAGGPRAGRKFLALSRGRECPYRRQATLSRAGFAAGRPEMRRLGGQWIGRFPDASRGAGVDPRLTSPNRCERSKMALDVADSELKARHRALWAS